MGANEGCVMFICPNCQLIMKCTKTGRAVVFGTDTVYFGDQYTCSQCAQSVVYSNSGKPSVWQGALVRLKENASDQRIHGFTPDEPIAMAVSPPVANTPILTSRELHRLNQASIESIIFTNDLNRSAVHFSNNLTEEETIMLLEHPEFDSFTPEFREIIWDAIVPIFKKELKGKNQSNS